MVKVTTVVVSLEVFRMSLPVVVLVARAIRSRALVAARVRARAAGRNVTTPADLDTSRVVAALQLAREEAFSDEEIAAALLRALRGGA